MGVGAGWLKPEFDAMVQPPFAERGAVTDRRCDEPPGSAMRGIRSGRTVTIPLDSLPRLKAGIARLRRLTDKAGRDPSRVAVVYRVKRIGTGLPARASDGERRLFCGSDDEIIGDLRAMQAIGAAGVDFDIERPTREAAIDALRRMHHAIIAPAAA